MDEFDDRPGCFYWLRYEVPWPEILLVLVLILAIVGAIADGLPDKGTDYVGMPGVQNGYQVVCEKVSFWGNCTKWDKAGINDSLDVADFFGPNTFGVAKGEMPRIPDDAPFAPILNVWASWTFSVSVSMNISFFAASIILITLFGLAAIVLVAAVTKTMNASLALAIVALPFYTSFLSIGVLAGSAFFIGFLHVVILPGIVITIFLLRIKRFRRGKTTTQTAEGDLTMTDLTDIQF